MFEFWLFNLLGFFFRPIIIQVSLLELTFNNGEWPFTSRQTLIDVKIFPKDIL
jgi:hypothetical protein